ncbi:[Fe-Fe] hydrogenase large subunit C-terminal domain-containing protein [Anaeromassilibacillus sp. An172]|uniref:[Fe-Fe] hydrogenase large subunit C-terminal domain-containing protein n=1 Tax=Anaeromassilibacillus sp. An172 TaxID=1965570 RepID=UPI000B3A5438|nr:[Fe-Fe] hydrogenase large subunit C-terminal domain-containing protein [Anaeromassilibacillus sp. An172]
MPEYFHSVVLEEDKCCGCTNCIKRCPTEAIRVRDGKAHIITERCIDCGECIRVCPHHAKKARSDSIEEIEKFKYKIAIPAPALFGQFNNMDDIDIVLNGLLKLGFDSVYEVSRGAELVSQATRQLIRENKLKHPIISSACPAVVRLIKQRFPDLCENVMPMKAPMEVSAMLAKKYAMEETGLPMEDIGAFFITPCPAKVTEINRPMDVNKRSYCDGAIAISKIYPKLTSAMDKLTSIEPLANSGVIGVGWATSGGESAAMLGDRYLAADGIENVIRVLEELEDERIRNVDFVELNACTGGCVGGVLTVENPYVAQARIHTLRKYLPVSQNHLKDGVPDKMMWDKPLEYDENVLSLDKDINRAMEMMEQIEKIEASLPGLDCGSCGAPSCHAMAEDIVKGSAKETECIFKLREQIQQVYRDLMQMM